MVRDSPISPDGQTIAHRVGDVIQLVPLQPSSDEIAFRRAKARFDPFWTEEQAKLAEQEKNVFAAAFFRSTLAEWDPANGAKWKTALEAGRILGDYRHVLAACDRVLMREPTLAPIYRQRSITRQLAGDPSGAWSDLLTVALSPPAHVEGWPDFARSAAERGEYDWAWHWQPNDPWRGSILAWQQLSRGNEAAFRATAKQLHDRSAGIDDLKTPFTISAHLADLLSPVPALSRGCGQWVVDECLLREAVKRADAIVYTASILPDCGGLDPRGLLRLAEQSFGPNVKDWSQQETLGTIHYRTGNFEKAIDFLERAARQNERNWQRLLLAMAYQHSGKPEKAREWFNKATKPKSPGWIDTLIWDRLRPEAEEALKKAVP
jgi:tetratricopeptide (TPR) repeat protein